MLCTRRNQKIEVRDDATIEYCPDTVTLHVCHVQGASITLTPETSTNGCTRTERTTVGCWEPMLLSTEMPLTNKSYTCHPNQSDMR